MVDVRALLKTKRQEARISHPFASYHPTGQLRCTACGITVKHPSAWEGHLGSKTHRTAVAQLKETRTKKERQDQGDNPESMPVSQTKKRERTQPDLLDNSLKKRRLSRVGSSDLPTDFFSQHLEVEYPSSAQERDNDTKGRLADTLSTDLESEYERFQREVVSMPDYSETYDRATLVVDAQIYDNFPKTLRTDDKPSQGALNAEDRNSVEERHLILDRLMDEERAQEEADLRISSMRKRLEAVRRKRQAKQAMAIDT
ncbi:hypothetical protein AMATHDRAFT_51742 [Amanita thiersii Skay4041]|uniref:C2H2-type domain-containing protein n=1 Tax=Amanita thiersii Skay4041 TaxID=703135 RepID=A0A2A9NC26_9AGAR|nr:hypothetical protein AMATHDRAFT_51742 [Amanita thiersii Skay4041]